VTKKWLKPSQQAVLVALERSQVDYLLTEMSTDELRAGARCFGAATVVRKIVADAIAAHRAARAARRADAALARVLPPADIAPPTKRQLMARR
jgi:hypothetical protein